MRIINAEKNCTLCIGVQGENIATQVRFPVVEKWTALYGQGTFQLLYKRQGDENPYACIVGIDGDSVTWDITSTETAAPGSGRCELYYYVGDTVAISAQYRTNCVKSLGDAGSDPPEPWESWVSEVLQAGAAAQSAATQAQEAQASAGASASSATSSAESAAASASSAADSAESAAESAEEAARYALYPVDKTDEMTQPVGKDANGKLYTKPGISGGSTAEEISYDSTGSGSTAKNVQEALDDIYASKQDTIADLDTIRSGAAAGATALQSVPPTYRTAAQQDVIDDAQDAAVSGIASKIPSAASATNKLVDEQQMSDAISSVEAKQLYKTSSQGSFATKAELTAATVFYNADGTVATPTKNDVAYILADETHSGKLAKYVIAGTNPIVWGFVIAINATDFTQEQLDAINSGATSAKIGGYDTHVANGNIHVTSTQKSGWDAKYSKPSGGIPASDLAISIDTTPTAGSSNLVTSGGVAGALSGKQDEAVTRTVTIAAADWVGGTTCTKSVTGVTATSIVIVDTSDGNVECTGQGVGTLTFTAKSTPTAAVTVKVVIL